MSLFAERCGVFDAAAAERVLQSVAEQRVEQVRVAWADLHGQWRSKTLLPRALRAAFEDGVGMVSTLLLKDTSDRTALPVFEPGALQALQSLPGLGGFGPANNLLLLPDAASFRLLPWADGTGWLRADPWFDDATPVAIDPRRVLQQALALLASETGHGLRCGLEVEFHIYRISAEAADPAAAAWPGEPPAVTLLHPGWQLLSDSHGDAAHEALAIVRRTALALGLPLRSLEIEFGPSQFEAVFDATDALTAADQMLLFRNGVRQALRRAGYHASFVCRPPFDNVCASGWHLHQSLVRLGTDTGAAANAFMRNPSEGGDHAAAAQPGDARHWLSDTGARWLAGLLAHGRGAALLGTPTVNGHGRVRPGAMAPVAVCWGRDNRGAMLRVLGRAGDPATRIENRCGEPLANPYLYIAGQVHAGLDGLRRGLLPPPAALVVDAGDAGDGKAGAADGAEALPRTLNEAIDAFNADAVLVQGLGAPLAAVYTSVKRQEAARCAADPDPVAWQRREYFARY